MLGDRDNLNRQQLKGYPGVFFLGCCAGALIASALLLGIHNKANNRSVSYLSPDKISSITHYCENNEVIDVVKSEMAVLAAQIQKLENISLVSSAELSRGSEERLSESGDEFVYESPSALPLGEHLELLEQVDNMIEAAAIDQEWGVNEKENFKHIVSNLPPAEKLIAMERVVTAINDGSLLLQDGMSLLSSDF